MYIVFLSGHTNRLKLSLGCEVIEKDVFRLLICSGGDTPNFGHAFSNRTHSRACSRHRFSVVGILFVPFSEFGQYLKNRVRRLNGQTTRVRSECLKIVTKLTVLLYRHDSYAVMLWLHV